MKFLLVCLLSLAIGLAKSAHEDTYPLATWSVGKVQSDDVDGELSKAPESQRPQFKSDPNAIARIVDSIHVFRELTRRAKETSFDKNDIVQKQIQLAAEKELGNAYLAHLTTAHVLARGDLTDAARERYTLSQQKYSAEERRTLAHILVTTKGRTDAEALAKIREIETRLKNEPEKFATLALEYSEDSGTQRRGGSLGVMVKGKMVKEFEDAAMTLTKTGEISPPVKTQFGYHLIKLQSHQPARTQSFDEVKSQIIEEMKSTIAKNFQDSLIAEIRKDPSLKPDDAGFEKYTGAKRIVPTAAPPKQ